jgi:hypothetical protein
MLVAPCSSPALPARQRDPGPLAAGRFALGPRMTSGGSRAHALDADSGRLLTALTRDARSAVGPVGLEPTTRGLKVRCSAN